MYQRGEIIEHVTLWPVVLSCYGGGLALGLLGVPSSLPGALGWSFLIMPKTTGKTHDAADDGCAPDSETTNASSNEQQHAVGRRAVGT